MVDRIYVEKIPKKDSGKAKIISDIKNTYGIDLSYFRRILRYDIEDVSKETLDQAKISIFSEPTVDNILENIDDLKDKQVVIVEYLDGQFDQRADSASQCVQLLTAGEKPLVRYATVYVFSGLKEDELSKVKKYLINPVDSKEGDFEIPKTLKRPEAIKEAKRVELNSFIKMGKAELENFYKEFSFAMNFEDLVFVQDYFKKLDRDPTLTEVKVIDTYWSDHCRHTTFLTEIKNVQIVSENSHIEDTFKKYQKTFKELYKDRPDKYPCLMDVATIAVKQLRKEGYLQAMDISEEVNACSVNVMVDNDGQEEEWLIMFKNETHNHPTEIEPFGGAATCLGGAIRDPLSGRAYVYQAMRITGAGNPLEDVSKTIEGKLPQRFLTKTALAGFSSYGNQIGLATGIVHELYNDRFKAKRLETGYVIGGAPKRNVVRETPKDGDIVILVGGDTGRDGCGGATGSSKAHTASSLETCGAEVQKGNAPEERKLQRLFRNEEAAKLIIRSNDFGAGGVCVAIGELSPGLDIFLDRVPKKYDGLSATEIAISESQERMAVVVHKEDVNRFLEIASNENLKATEVATITSNNKLRMFYENETIVDIDRSFLDTNGVKQVQDVIVKEDVCTFFNSLDDETELLLEQEKMEEALIKEMSKLENCSKKGMGEVFDGTIGAASVFMPFGGNNQLTPATIMASKPPVSGFTHTVTCSSYGIYPELMINSPYIGAIYSVVNAVSKLVASGVKYDSIYLTLQEFFLRVKKDPIRWGQPLAALLGAYDAQTNLKIGAIGGKDSMSGSFEKIDVPPTLIAFGMGVSKDTNIVHNTFPQKGKVYIFKTKRDRFSKPDYSSLKKDYEYIETLIQEKKVLSSAVVEGSIISTITKSLLGNMSGINLISLDRDFFVPSIGDIIIVTYSQEVLERGEYIGELEKAPFITHPLGKISLKKILSAYSATLEPVFPTVYPVDEKVENISYSTNKAWKAKTRVKPNVFIPVFPGTNCEYDTIKAFERAGATTSHFVIRNLTPSDISSSIKEMKKLIANSQIIAFPGGFSLGDEPDGSGKFIATAFRNPELKEAVLDLLYKRDGLALGICNGFQALIKLGLLPFGEIVPQNRDSATLTFNNISRHVSTISKIRIASNNSPWLSSFRVGEIFSVPISHGEGKIIGSNEILNKIIKNGQVATQYCDDFGNATMESPYNPNGSSRAIEGLISPDGRVLGKMGHAERWQEGLYQNVKGNYDMNIFRSGVRYFE